MNHSDQLLVFMDAVDEAAFETALRSRVSDVVFVDGLSWAEGTDVPLKPSLADCESSVVAMWSPDGGRYETAVVGGTVRGAQTGSAVQFLRTVVQDDAALGTAAALSGRVAWSYESDIVANRRFADAVITSVMESTPVQLRDPTGAMVRYRAGSSIAVWSQEPGNLLRDRTVPLNFETAFVRPDDIQ